MERHIYSIVFEHLADQEFLSAAQWGFCPGKSTVTALVSTFHNILQLMENGFDVSLVFFDLRKAFDSVPHLPLLHKLKDIGLNQHILQWMHRTYATDNNMLWWMVLHLILPLCYPVFHRVQFWGLYCFLFISTMFPL